ncbi:MAG: hypothetical protein R3B06_27285 [Kofleriaceae bacterium]
MVVLAIAVATTPGGVRADASAPTVTVRGCGFDAAALVAALDHEAAPRAITIAVACAADGNAVVEVSRAEGTRARPVDLRDVPTALAPRVLALVVAAIDDAPAIAPVTPTGAPEVASATTAVVTHSPAATGPSVADRRVAGVDVPAPTPARAAAIGPSTRWRRGGAGRVLLRRYGAATLVGAGAELAFGPVGVGVDASTGTVAHPLGTVTARALALDATVTIACTRSRPSMCGGVRAALGRQWIAAAATTSVPPDDPTAAVMTAGLAGYSAHAAAEVSVTIPVGGLAVTATGAVGLGAGVVARANDAEVLHLAGLTVGGALEVRR